MIDSVLRIETPEGIELHIHPAGPAPRAIAWFLDALIRGGIYLVGGLLLISLGGVGVGIGLVGVFLVEWFYPVVFELGRKGATPGKQVMGLRVVNRDGTPVNLAGSIIRNFLRGVDWLPSFYGFGLLSCLLTKQFQRLGDLAAGTLVVYSDPVPSSPAMEQANPVPVPVALQLDEARSVVEFAERKPWLSDTRAEELASLVPSLSEGKEPVSPTSLVGMGHWILGKGR